MTAAEAKVVRARSVDSALALCGPVMKGGNRNAGDLANLLCGKHFPSIVSQAHCALHPDHQPLIVYYDILSATLRLCDSQ
jgi:hypothetical protein